MKKKLLTLLTLLLCSVTTWADDELPAGVSFTSVEYIASNSDRLRLEGFTTDYIPSSKTKICIGFQSTGEINSWQAIFCARNINAGTGMSLYMNGNGSKLAYFTGNSGDDDFIDYDKGKRYDVEATNGQLKWKVDGGNEQTKKTSWGDFQSTSRNLTFFANPEKDQSFVGKIYYAQIYEEETLKRDYIPVKLSTGGVALYDKINKKYVKHASAYSAGDDVENSTLNAPGYTEVKSIHCAKDSWREVCYTTDYRPNINTVVETAFKCATQSANNWQAIFCGRNGASSTTGISLYVHNSGTMIGFFTGSRGGADDNFLQIEGNTRYDVIAQTTKLEYKKEGDDNYTTTVTGSTEMFETKNPISIFANPDHDQRFQGDIYYLRIKENQTDGNSILKHDFVPVKDIMGNCYFYDKVAKKVLAPAKGYVAGPVVVKDIEITPISYQGTGDAVVPSIKYTSGDALETAKEALSWSFSSNENYGNDGINNPKFNVVLATPGKDDNGNNWYDVDYQLTNTNGIDWKYDKTTLPNSWGSNDKPADVYVRRYFTVDGTLPEHLYMPTPHDDSPCEYYINGQLVWSFTGRTQTDGYNEDEIIVLTDEQKNLIHTDGTKNVFAYHVHQNWGGLYADGGIYGGGTPKTRCEEYWTLLPTVKLAEDRRMDVSKYRTAVDSRMYSLLKDAKLYALRTLIRMDVLEKTENTFAGNTPTAGGNYYLYNIGSKAFFCGGSDWGAHAAIGFPGIKITLEEASDGKFYINTHLQNGEDNGVKKEYLNTTGYCDTPSKAEWKFESDDNRVYYIKKNDGYMLGWNSGTTNGFDGAVGPYPFNVFTGQGDKNNNNNKWVLVTEEQRDALMENANVDNAVDISYKIQSPNFNQREDITAWKMQNGKISGRGDRPPYYIYDAYNVNSSDIHQTIEGLQPGLYEVAVTAVYRKPRYADGTDTKARLYAYSGEAQNDYSAKEDATAVLLPNITVGTNKAPGYENAEAGGSYFALPGTHVNASNFVELGAFPQTSVRVVVGVDGKLTLGIMAQDGGDSDCTYADNFRLRYLGKYSVESTISKVGWSTMYYSNYSLKVPVNVEARTYTEENGVLKVGKKYSVGDVIPAGEAVVLKDLAVDGTNSHEYSFELQALAGEKDEQNKLKGSDVSAQTEGAEGSKYYKLSTKNGGNVGFYWGADNGGKFTNGAHKAYLVLPSTSNISAFYLDDEETSVDKVTSTTPAEEQRIYNLAGQRIMKMQQGVNIINGKKILR